MKKQIKYTVVMLLAILVVVAIAIPSINGDGSEWIARRWVKRFADVHSVSDALERYQVARREFPDGSWIVGIAVGSHGNPFGGTIVTKDSTGLTRVFFGHVSTPATLAHTIHKSQSASLKEAFSNLTAHGRLNEQELK
jgi:hypothetical protein